MYSFRGLSKITPYDFLKFNPSYFTPYVKLITKWKSQIFGFKNVMERGIRKILTFIKHLHLTFSGK